MVYPLGEPPGLVNADRIICGYSLTWNTTTNYQMWKVSFFQL